MLRNSFKASHTNRVQPTDKKTFNAVIRAIEVIGEAIGEATKLSCQRSEQIYRCSVEGNGGNARQGYSFLFRRGPGGGLVAKERIPAIKPMIEQILRDLEEKEE